ncbi:MAG: helix-turn-helix transcriptional regulator [Prevotellaceae bacterium]|nr:helix-turn-helix transcriptional regulator [Prevotellaceae bacterium]MDY3856289.1 helix-turn-helix transcriptional regulator [Bacteroidaceae bacterium]
MTERTEQYNRIKAALADKQMTSKSLAEKIGKSENTVSRWVANRIQPSIPQLYEVAKILNVDVRELLVFTSKI